MIGSAAKRTILRSIHLMITIPILGFIYGEPADVQPYASGVRFIFVPVMILSGYWMYAGVIFAVVGVALWLAAYQLSGYGAALLSQVALFIARKIWLGGSCAKGTGKGMTSPKRRFDSIEQYLASLGPVKARTLRSVIDLILAEFPELESKISWNVPTIHRKGKYVVGLAAYKHHLTFSAWSARVIADFKARLGKFVVMKNCFQIPIDWQIDRKLVKDLVRARLAELD